MVLCERPWLTSTKLRREWDCFHIAKMEADDLFNLLAGIENTQRNKAVCFRE
jgi:hypothetical protein